MSSISAGTTSTTTLVHSGDTTGSLVFKTNDTGSGGTTAVTIDTSQRVAFVAGTVALPAITTSGDTNTGIFFPAADTIAFAEGGTEAMRIDSSGNVGIGTASPSTFGKLAVSVAGTTTPTNLTNVGPSSVNLYAATNGGSTDSTMGVFGWNASSGIGSGIGFSRENASDWGTQLRFYTHPTSTSNIGDITERMRINSNGNLLVGTTTQTATPAQGVILGGADSSSGVYIGHANGTSSGNYYMAFSYNGGAIGSITQNGTTNVAYNTSSDYRLKENIQPMQNALATISQLKPVTYKWKTDGSDGQGFIAHELQAVVPDCVTGEKDAVDANGNPVYQGIDTSFLVATLTAALQETKALIDQQAETINALTARVVALEGQ